MRDRKRKISDRKSTVFGRAIFFSFREQKLSYVRSKSRLGFSCGVSGMPAVGIIRNLNLRVLTQLRLELLRAQLLLYNCTGWISTQSICTCCRTGVATILCVACCSCSTLYIVCIYIFVHVRSTSQRGSLIPVASFIYSSVVRSRNVHQPLYCCRLSMVAVLVAANTIPSQGSFIYPIALAIIPWHLRSHVRLPAAPTMYVCTRT